MLTRILTNVARFVASFIVATVLVFLFMRAIPGDPAQIALGVNATPELIAKTRAEFGTDRPLVVQYFDWVRGLPFGNFGTSYVTHQDISPMIADRVQVSLILVVLAMLVALIFAIPLGTLAAVRHRQSHRVIVLACDQQHG